MKKLSKVKLQNAIVLKEQEMKMVLGGSYGQAKCSPCRCYDPSTSQYGSSISNAGGGDYDSCASACRIHMGSSYAGFQCG